jgi:drug/metabolite transporter (DMT)-like permease
MRGRVFLLYILCCLLWGSTWMAIKVGLEDLPPFLFAGVRMLIATSVLAPLALRNGFPGSIRQEWRWVTAAGVLQLGLSYAAIFFSERFIASGLAATLFCTFPIWALVFAHFMLQGERLTALHLTSALLGLAGIVVLELPMMRNVELRDSPALALFLPLIASISSALGNVWLKRHLAHVPVVANLWAQTLVGACFLLLCHTVLERGEAAHWTARGLAALLYLAVPGTVVTFLSLFWLIPRVPMAVIGIIPLIDTLIAIALGSIVLREPFGPRLLAGAVLVLGGAALASRTRTPAMVTS